MASNYENITRKNISELGTKTSTRKVQICMYSDLTHFVYELLQNADDYGASEVLFQLTNSELIVEHDGALFTPDNVHAISTFGESTSQADMLKTGRFGVGFKSVFTFTATPIIISGDEHFIIRDLYKLSEYPYPNDLSKDRTRFILPFNHDTEKPDFVFDLMTADDAYKKISARLTGLNMHTLLFTRNIREIRWEINGKHGHYLREDRAEGQARYTSITDGDNLMKHLVFSRTPSWEGQSYKDIDIAFCLDDDNQITIVDNAFLHVLFSTTQETHLKFILNGPFRTNPARETISEEDSFNCHLIRETGRLLGDILPYLRDNGLLNDQLLGVLPNESDSLRTFYRPLLEEIVERFQLEELVPTDDNRFSSSQRVLHGPSKLREVIRPAELMFLGQINSASWAKGTTNNRADSFLKCLKIMKWGYEELLNALKSKYLSYQAPGADNSKWLADRSDEWLQSLYMLLGDALDKGECDEWSIQHCSIVRIECNSITSHVAGSAAYFPKGASYKDLPQIKPSILRGKNEQQNKKIESSLIAFGVREIGEEERIDLILRTYYNSESPKVSWHQHLDHMRLFMNWRLKDQSAHKFHHKNIFRAAGIDDMQAPHSCYLDAPLKATGLGAIYRKTRHGFNQKRMLWEKYSELSIDRFCDFAAACGVDASLPIKRQKCVNHPMKGDLRQDYLRSHNTRLSSNAIDEDYIIPELDKLLQLQDIEVNRLIWDTLREADPSVLKAQFRPNGQFKPRIEKSSLVLALSNAIWVPDASMAFHKPADITRESLHRSFTYDDRNGWLSAIGFSEIAQKASAKYKQMQESAKALGLDMEVVELLEGLSPEERAEKNADIKSILKHRDQEKKHPTPFHEAFSETFIGGHHQVSSTPTEHVSGTSRNPDRRQAILEAEIRENILNEPAPKTRFKIGPQRKWTAKNELVRQKLLHWYKGKCQICERTFIQSNNEPYFEAQYIVSRIQAEWIDRPGNVLCLCPWHSAMFQFGSKIVDQDISSHILSFVPKASGGIMPAIIDITLCGSAEKIKFHEDHFIELKAMIQESQKASNIGQKDASVGSVHA